MKRHLIIGGICLLLSACGSGGSSQVTDPGAARNFNYNFDETSGATAVNSNSPGHFDGVIYGAIRVPGKVGGALQFGSSFGSRVEIPMQDPTSFNYLKIPFDNAISIGAWIMLTSVPQSSIYHIVGNGYYGETSFRLQINSSGQIEFLLSDNITWHTIVTSNQALTQDTWCYIVVTYDETTGRIYINGVEDSNFNISFHLLTNYNTIYIGAIDNDVNAQLPYQNQFVGIIDELRISKDLWTPQQILEYYDSTK